MMQIHQLLPLLARLADRGGKPKSLAELAVEAGKSPWHLQRVFTRELGESPKQYSQRIRLQQATASLLVTELPVIEIAFAVGFESHEGFTRAFKKRFGESPSTFRTQHRPGFERLVASNRTHLNAVERSAPCMGLYHLSSQPVSEPTTERGTSMTYEMTTKTIEETVFCYATQQTDQAEIAKTLEEIFMPLFQHCIEKGLPLAGPPSTRYPSFGPGLLTLEAGMPLSGTLEELASADTGDYKLGVLQADLAVSTIHTGRYEELGEAYAALQRWMQANNKESAGAPWETYLTDPGEVPNPEEWRTEVIHPIVEAI